jgi:hypothetical protein
MAHELPPCVSEVFVRIQGHVLRLLTVCKTYGGRRQSVLCYLIPPILVLLGAGGHRHDTTPENASAQLNSTLESNLRKVERCL